MLKKFTIKSKKFMALMLAVMMTIGLIAVSNIAPAVASYAAVETDTTPRQVNAHFGDDASTEINISFTTKAATPTVVTYHIVGGDEILTARGLAFQNDPTTKYFHGIALFGLKPGTQYEYTVGTAPNTYTGHFKTAPEQGSTGSFKFAYLADTQVSNATNARALGATLQAVANGGYDFVYLAGDHTDTAANESQWEWLFNNGGAFPNGGQNMYGNNTVAVTQGNHDNNTLARHINAPAEMGNIVYSFDYGPATFIVLNLEASNASSVSRDAQAEYLRTVVEIAKERGQWTFVGFHKSLYTGASHISDSDVVTARKYWSPIFAELDVDFVLQGHDHVYSRGFVAADGSKAIDAPYGSVVESPDNAPLYMVGGHAGGLKWYSKVNYNVGSGDPLLAGYAFLDANSASDGSDVKQEQWIIELEVTNDSVTVIAKAFKYDTSTDAITTESYVYDTFTVTREVPPEREVKAEISGTEKLVKETSNNIAEYTVSANDLADANVVTLQVKYDATKLAFADAASLLPGTVIATKTDVAGVVTVAVFTSTPIAANDAVDIVKITFTPKADYAATSTTVQLLGLSAAVPSESGVKAYPLTGEIVKGVVNTLLHSHTRASDLNRDGVVSIADLSLAMLFFRQSDLRGDINGDGVVDTLDLILITTYLT